MIGIKPIRNHINPARKWPQIKEVLAESREVRVSRSTIIITWMVIVHVIKWSKKKKLESFQIQFITLGLYYTLLLMIATL